MRTIDDVRRAWPQWRIEHVGTELDGYVYIGHPADEATQPPVWEYDQMVRGLKNRVTEEDLAEFERQIGLQHKLREQMFASGETPFDGKTYVEMEHDRAELSDA